MEGLRRVVALVLVALILPACGTAPEAVSNSPSPVASASPAPPQPDLALVDAVQHGTAYVSATSWRRILQGQIADLLMLEEFDKVEPLLDLLRKQPADWRNQESPIEVAYDTAENLVMGDYPQDYRSFLYRISRWQRARPKSPHTFPFQVRTLTADLVDHWIKGRRETPEFVALSNEIPSVQEAVRRNKGLPDPEPYANMAQAAVYVQQSEAVMEDFFRRSEALQPYYMSSWAAKAQYLAPNWYGGGTWARAAAWADEEAKKPAGARNYARVLMSYLYAFRGNPFESMGLPWTKFQPGFQALLQDAPDSLWLTNLTCWLACQGNDLTTARPLFERIGANWDPEIWETRESFEGWRARASAKVPLQGTVTPLPSDGWKVGPEGKLLLDPMDRGAPLAWQVHALLQAQRFPELEELYRRIQEGLPGSFAQREAFQSGISEPYRERKEEWEALLDLQDRWIRAFPDSVAARTGQARTLLDYAWYARGSGYASEVTEEGWKLFRERVAKAAKWLDLAERDGGERDPMLYLNRLDCLKATTGDVEAASAAAARFVELVPGNASAWQSMGAFLLPRWHGRPGQAEEYARSEARRTGDPAALAAVAWVLYLYEGDAWIRAGTLPWKDVEKGFAAWTKQQPLAPNFEARMALARGDRAAARRAFARVKQWSPTVWYTREYFEACRRYAEDASAPDPFSKPRARVLKAGLLGAAGSEWALRKSTRKIPMKEGTLFGVQVRLEDLQPGMPYNYVQTIHHPPFEEGGERTERSTVSYWRSPEEPNTFWVVWQFAKHELVAGDWAIELTLDGEPLLFEEFQVVDP